MEENISKAVIRRLPRYYRYLSELTEEGIEKVSSLKMSEDMGLNASQIRRDLNCFGGFGQQGYGYSVEKLRQEIAKILGVDRRFNVIIIGAGRIGQALMGYKFTNEGFIINDIFDNANPIHKTMNAQDKKLMNEMQKRQKEVNEIINKYSQR